MENSLKQKVEDRVLNLLVLVSDLGLTNIEIPEIRFDMKGRSAGNCTYWGYKKICILRFNPEFLKEYEENFLKYTVAHEVAHYVVFMLYDRTEARPHGREWQMVMRVFGIENPRRCHNFCDVPNSRSPWIYRCKCQDHFFSTRRHNNVGKGMHYHCTECDGLLRFVKKAIV